MILNTTKINLVTPSSCILHYRANLSIRHIKLTDGTWDAKMMSKIVNVLAISEYPPNYEIIRQKAYDTIYQFANYTNSTWI